MRALKSDSLTVLSNQRENLVVAAELLQTAVYLPGLDEECTVRMTRLAVERLRDALCVLESELLVMDPPRLDPVVSVGRVEARDFNGAEP